MKVYLASPEATTLIAHPLRRATDPRPEPAPATAPRRPAVSLVIPVLDGTCDITWLLGQVPDCVEEVILVGDVRGHSPDGPVSRGGPCLRTVEQRTEGAGDVFHAGLLAAGGEHVVLIDSNGSMSPGEIPRYLHYLENGYDFVKGSRFIAGGGSVGYPLLRRVGQRVLLRVARRLYGQQLTDVWYGFCAFRREFLRLLDLRGDGVELGAEIVAHALHYGLRIAEVPSLELPRRDGASNLRTVHDGARILRTLLDERPRTALVRLVPAPRFRRVSARHTARSTPESKATNS
ncbi:glycosyltransferase [Streptomyces lunaelactis]|nr:glycosyltransferase [Streptomyces lunaelactis]